MHKEIVMFFKIYGVILSRYQDHDPLSCLLAVTEHSHKNQNNSFQPWWILLLLVHFPILWSRKDFISFHHELGWAHVKFDRLNQQSNL